MFLRMLHTPRLYADGNADYVASEVYRQTVTNLCPNTYYEFSAWVRNICPTCGIDSSRCPVCRYTYFTCQWIPRRVT
jgi:hypothetical protein